MSTFWNERFRHQEYIYGEQPNAYFKEVLDSIQHPGTILLPAEGEGRNAVYAANQGWKVEAFDQSTEGRKKALQLANKLNVSIHYSISEISKAQYPEYSYDALALIFAHLPSKLRRTYHQQLSSYLKRGGTLIIEGFSKRHIENQRINSKAGGPDNIDMLFDVETLRADFPGFDFVEAIDTDTVLNEGTHHVGAAAVVRILATKL